MGYRAMGVVLLAFSALSLVAIVLALVGGTTIDDVRAADLPRHELDVRLTPDILGVKVDEHELGTCTFGGNVTIEKVQAIQKVTVTLSAECSKRWPVVLSRQTLEFVDPGTELFQLSVVVPPGTMMQRGTVTVYATAESQIWQEQDSYTVNVTVLQYVKMDLWSDATMYEAEPGEMVGGRLFINNSGNGEDTFEVSLENEDELRKVFKGWDFEESITVPAGFYSEVYFSFDVPKDFDVPMEGALVQVVFKVESSKARVMNKLYAKTLQVNIHFKGLTQKLEERWPTYVGLGGGAAVLIAVPAFLLIRRRRRQEDELAKVLDERDLVPDKVPEG